jgi:hypothetical protein
MSLSAFGSAHAYNLYFAMTRGGAAPATEGAEIAHLPLLPEEGSACSTTCPRDNLTSVVDRQWGF